MLAGGSCWAPKVTVGGVVSAATAGGRTAASYGGLVAPRPVMKMDTMSPVTTAAMGFCPLALCAKKKNSGVAAWAGTVTEALRPSVDRPQLAITCTVTVPDWGMAGTWIFNCAGDTMRTGARCAFTSTHTPANWVGTFPATRSAAPTMASGDPDGAKFCPKMLTMALGESCVTRGTRSPTPTTPPCEICG